MVALLSSSAPRLTAGLCVLAALAAAGCGSSRSGHHASAASAASAAGATTSQPPTEVPTSSTSTTTTSTTTGTLPGSGKPTVTIGDKNYTEQFVLGQLYVQALRAQGFTVNLTPNIGPPAVFTRALQSRSLAMYPEYLDAFNSTVAGQHRRFDTRNQAYRAGQTWAKAHGLQLLAPTPFADTDAIAVTDTYAAEHHLRTLTDLRRVGTTLVLGGAAQFYDSTSGLTDLSRIYGVVPARFAAIGVGDQYAALNDRRIDAAYVNTTDGQLASGDYRLLGDPRRIFGWGNVVPVVSTAVLDREGPAFADTINRVDRMLTLGAMRQLNDAVDIAGQSPTAVAQQFLETHGLLGAVPPG